METFNQKKYINEYNKKTYKNFTFRIRKDEAEEITKFIKANTNLSMNEFFKQAVEEKIEKIRQELKQI